METVKAEVKVMKVTGEFELKSMDVAKTIGDEFGIYFVGEEGQRRLAFVFTQAKKAISSAKKLKRTLGVQYNIEKEIVETSLEEKEEVEEKSEKGTKKMANKKRNVNVKQLCRDAIEDGQSMEEVLKVVAAVYTGEGKDEKYAATRAKSVYSDICKEKGMAKPKRIKKVKEEAETAPESPAEEVQVQSEPEVPTEENTEVQAPTEPESEEAEEDNETEVTD